MSDTFEALRAVVGPLRARRVTWISPRPDAVEIAVSELLASASPEAFFRSLACEYLRRLPPRRRFAGADIFLMKYIMQLWLAMCLP